MLVGESRKAALSAKATVMWQTLIEAVLAYYATRSQANWQGAFAPALQGLIEAQAETLTTAFGIAWDVENLFAMEWFGQYVLQFAQPIARTSSDVMSALLVRGQHEGAGIDRIARNLEVLFDAWITGRVPDAPPEGWLFERMPLHRREMIARTETIRAGNAGSMEIMRQGGVPYKEWLATADDRTRDAHVEAWLDYREGGRIGPIRMEEAFIVGGVPMMYPGDPSAPPELTINCRCTVLPWFGEAQ